MKNNIQQNTMFSDTEHTKTLNELTSIKLVVVDENVFGYIDPERPTVCGVLVGSVLKGYRGDDWGSITIKTDSTPWGYDYRMVEESDFDEFRINREQYLSTRYGIEYIWNRQNS